MPASPLVFRPLPETRIACSLPGLAVVVAAVAGVRQQAGADIWVLAVAMMALGGVLAARGYRMAVIVQGTTVTVRGMVRTRMVPRRSVNALHGGDTSLLFARTPTMYWHDGTGTRRRTRLWMLGEPPHHFTGAPGYHRHALGRLRKCLGLNVDGSRRLR